MRVFDRTIAAIVDENYVYARALSYLGIEFYLYPNKKLGELCQEMGLVKERVIKSFYLFDQNHRFSFRELGNYPLPIVIQYLKHTHSTFVKNRLPYIARLIQHVEGKEDLKLIFPEFIEEFISHIHEEEDSVFGYIDQLLKVEKGEESSPASVLWKYRKFSLQQVHEEHLEEDELAGIRDLIDTFGDSDLHWKVIAHEIKAFDREMMYHAQIENRILFPKAIALEAKVREMMLEISRYN